MIGDDETPPASGKTGPQPPSPSITSTDQSGGLHAPHATINVHRDLILGAGAGGDAPWSPAPPLRRYLEWLATDAAQVNLRGIGGGDLHLRLADVYVPLSLTRSHAEEHPARRRRSADPGCDDTFEIAAIFGHLSADRRRRRDRHAIILGDPGSGKSTAMRKLDLLVRDQARRAAGEALRVGDGVDEILAAETLAGNFLPVRVLLRDFSRADKERSLRDFVARELKRRSDDAIDDAAIEALWAHGRLVLILDGLDEIAEVEVRDGFCRKLNNFAAGQELGEARIVVTSRRAGYQELQVAPSEAFTRVRLESLSPDQAKRLIGQWFRALVGKVDDFSDGDADMRTDELSRAIEDPRFALERRSFYSTPLITSLLCVMNYRECRMPESRVEFYETCLRMLLETWPESKREGASAGRRAERPLTTTKAIDLLAPLAYASHAGRTGEQLHPQVILAHIGRRLGVIGPERQAVLDWLHKDVGIFEAPSSKEFIFFHLGVQEYLAALHVAMAGDNEIRALAGRLREARWTEVLLMVGALPLRRAFAPLMHELLARFDPARPDDVELLGLAVREGDFEVSPFAEHLGDAALSGAKALQILTLVKDRHGTELIGPARGLAARAREEAAPLPVSAPERKVWEAVEARATQLVATIECVDTGNARDYDVAVVGPSDALAARKALLQRLRTVTPPLRVWPPEEEGAGRPLGELDVDAVTAAADAVLVIFVDDAPWEEGEVAAAQLALLAQDRPLTLVLAPGATVSLDGVPAEALELAPIDQRARGAWDEEALLRRLRRRPGNSSAAPVVGALVRELKRVCEEPKTGMRFVWVPAGTFMMGSGALDDDSRPEHLVKVPEFWIGETPVTNRIYRLFVEAEGGREPLAWRDRRFGDPEQPVVTVSWDDARAFCAWMSEITGWAVGVPSEAQWEYAARGRDGRPYPWGGEAPDATRACFARGDQGRPAAVGSHPAGMGPFGALDQSGNVWEWCEDVWNPAVYRDRDLPPSVNEARVVTEGRDSMSHAIRGGSWYDGNNRGALAAAFRSRYWHGYLDDVSIGFRVVVAREPGPST